VSKSERKGQGGSDLRKLYIVLAVVAAIGVGAVGYSVASGGGGAVTGPVAVEGLDDLERLVELAQGVTKGNENAPITIIEFGDYQCPACQAFALQVKPQVELNYVEAGRAKFVYYDWPIVTGHPNAFLAARASRCAADQGRYWEYHDNLFRNQSRWAALTAPASTFVEYAETLGLDRGTFSSCLNSAQHAELVTANMELGNVLGVNGTPTIYVEHGGSARRVPGDYMSISTYIETLLAEVPGGV
jgi:protein-disulfide isomerase